VCLCGFVLRGVLLPSSFSVCLYTHPPTHTHTHMHPYTQTDGRTDRQTQTHTHIHNNQTTAPKVGTALPQSVSHTSAFKFSPPLHSHPISTCARVGGGMEIRNVCARDIHTYTRIHTYIRMYIPRAHITNFTCMDASIDSWIDR